MDEITGKADLGRLSVTLHNVRLDEAVVAWNVGIVNSVDDRRLNPQSTGDKVRV